MGTPSRGPIVRLGTFIGAACLATATSLFVPNTASAGLPTPPPEVAVTSPAPLPLPIFPIPATAPLAPVTELPAPTDAASTTSDAASTTSNEARGNEKVTLCHATSSVANPYTLITVAESAINGHDGHTGPVFDPATSQSGDNWGDLIPAVGDFPGLNNTLSGADILANGCAVPEPVDPVDPNRPAVPITPTVPTVPNKPAKPITPTVPVLPHVPQIPVVPGLPGSNRFFVTLCHATGSVARPYLRTAAWAASLAELQHDIETGHDTHGGSPFDPNTNVSGDSWGDIIPAFAEYDGLNNTGAGAAILADGCNVPPSIGAYPLAWNICHWNATDQPPTYVRTTLTAPTPDQLLVLLQQHAVETGAGGERDVIPTTRAGSAGLVCPAAGSGSGTGTTPPAIAPVTATVTVKAQMCHAEAGVYAKRSEVAVESASGPDMASAQAAATAKANTRLVAQLTYHANHDVADIIEPFGTFDGYHWGNEGQLIFSRDCIVDVPPRNSDLLRPRPGIAGGTTSPGYSGEIPETGK